MAYRYDEDEPLSPDEEEIVEDEEVVVVPEEEDDDPDPVYEDYGDSYDEDDE
jgi:hypothetical protein